MGQPQRQPSCLARELPQTRKLMCAPINLPVPLSCHSSARSVLQLPSLLSTTHPPSTYSPTRSPIYLPSSSHPPTQPLIGKHAPLPTHPFMSHGWGHFRMNMRRRFPEVLKLEPSLCILLPCNPWLPLRGLSAHAHL